MKSYRFDDRFQFIVVKTKFYIPHHKTIVGGNSSAGAPARAKITNTYWLYN